MVDILHNHIAFFQHFLSVQFFSAVQGAPLKLFLQPAQTAQKCGFSGTVVTGHCNDASGWDFLIRHMQHFFFIKAEAVVQQLQKIILSHLLRQLKPLHGHTPQSEFVHLFLGKGGKFFHRNIKYNSALY